MTAIVTEVTRYTIMSIRPETLTTTFGVVAILLLLALLVQKELMRVLGGRSVKSWQQTLNIAITPLLAAFGVIMIVRFISLLR